MAIVRKVITLRTKTINKSDNSTALRVLTVEISKNKLMIRVITIIVITETVRVIRKVVSLITVKIRLITNTIAKIVKTVIKKKVKLLITWMLGAIICVITIITTTKNDNRSRSSDISDNNISDS